MRITAFKHFFHRLAHRSRPAKHARSAPPVLTVDPFWHGDHWQNLLASPMDARHYVMEDWAVPASDEFEASSASWQKERRGGRRRPH